MATDAKRWGSNDSTNENSQNIKIITKNSQNVKISRNNAWVFGMDEGDFKREARLA